MIGLLIIFTTCDRKSASSIVRLFIIFLSVIIPTGSLDSFTRTTHPILLSFIILHTLNSDPVD
jgi:hypothetical protein